ncbi:MAG: cytochrome c3 family protein [Sutterella sp.]|nr:cytochrome c3 family protein [Sutterella sp.]
MKKLLIASLFALAFTGAASAQTKTLQEMHGAMWPKQNSTWAVKDQCLKCHGSWEKLAEQTKSLVPNPHYSHLGEVDCIACHKADKSEPELKCNECHKFTIHKKDAQAAK